VALFLAAAIDFLLTRLRTASSIRSHLLITTDAGFAFVYDRIGNLFILFVMPASDPHTNIARSQRAMGVFGAVDTEELDRIPNATVLRITAVSIST